MITLATKDVINYLVLNLHLKNKANFKESSKESEIYMIVDYYDWLEFISKNQVSSEIKLLNQADYYADIYNSCIDIIKATQNTLTVSTLNKLTLNNTLGIEGNLLQYLLQGYQSFVQDLEMIQQFYLENYEWNNNNYPKLMIPFSFGLNRLCVEHYTFDCVIDEELGLPLIHTKRGILKDECNRVKIDLLGTRCKIVTSNYTNNFSGSNIQLPKAWTFKCNIFYDNKSSNVNKKISAVNNAYCNYQCVGIEENFEYEPNYDKVFLLNYPFPIREVQDQNAEVTSGTANLYVKSDFGIYLPEF